MHFRRIPRKVGLRVIAQGEPPDPDLDFLKRQNVTQGIAPRIRVAPSHLALDVEPEGRISVTLITAIEGIGHGSPPRKCPCRKSVASILRKQLAPCNGHPMAGTPDSEETGGVAGSID
jgi:hypothetical protein